MKITKEIHNALEIWAENANHSECDKFVYYFLILKNFGQQRLQSVSQT